MKRLIRDNIVREVLTQQEAEALIAKGFTLLSEKEAAEQEEAADEMKEEEEESKPKKKAKKADQNG